MNTAWVYAGWTALLVGAVVVVILLRNRRGTSSDPMATGSPDTSHPDLSSPPKADPRQKESRSEDKTTTDTPSADQSHSEQLDAGDTGETGVVDETDATSAAGESAAGESQTATVEADDPATNDPNEVLIAPSSPKDAFELDSITRSITRELWVSQWMLGEDACADLAAALERVRAITQSCLSDTTVENGAVAHCPPDCQRLNSTIAALEEAARPLRSLRVTKYQHALAAMRTETPQDINPHRAAIRNDHEVSPDPTFGLHRLVSETRYGLDGARLEIARVSPTAGSTTSRRLRNGLSQASGTLRAADERLKSLVASANYTPTTDELIGLERSITEAVWWRRFIENTVSYLTAREWALTSSDPDEWGSLARSALELADLIVDLERQTVPVQTLADLGRCHVLAGGERTPQRTYRSIVETADTAIEQLTTSEDTSP